jgi:hypothetical protein
MIPKLNSRILFFSKRSLILSATLVALPMLLQAKDLPSAAADSQPLTMDQVRQEIQKEAMERSTKGGPGEPSRPGWASWGQFDTEKGFLVANTPLASMRITGYMLIRYLNQAPAGQSFTDHLGVSHEIHMRNDFSAPHRVLLNFTGFMFDPKFLYTATLWTVNAINTVAIIGHLDYLFHPMFNLSAGVGSMPGTRSLTYNHPYWMGTDRVMADEFFRPGFTQGVWASGELLHRLFYTAMVGNNITTVNVSAAENKRNLATGGTLWWLPTTGEFGPKGAYGDFEEHKNLAVRMGTSYTHSREDQLTTDPDNPFPDETQIRLADSLLLFQLGSLAPGVQVHQANYDMSAVDFGIKYKGLFMQTEVYNRWLSKFDVSGGVAPMSQIYDHGLYLQIAQMVVPKKFELYTAASWVFGDKDAGFSNSSDYLIGVNRYLYGTRNCRLNLQVNFVNHSPTGSNFGYYAGGQKGVIYSAGWSINF